MRELLILAPSPPLMLSNVRAYAEQEEEERVVKTRGFEISGPRNHKGAISLQLLSMNSMKNPNIFKSVLLPCFIPAPPSSLKKCAISHAEVFRIIAGMGSFMWSLFSAAVFSTV